MSLPDKSCLSKQNPSLLEGRGFCGITIKIIANPFLYRPNQHQDYRLKARRFLVQDWQFPLLRLPARAERYFLGLSPEIKSSQSQKDYNNNHPDEWSRFLFFLVHNSCVSLSIIRLIIRFFIFGTGGRRISFNHSVFESDN